ncbi:MAG TPA: tetratricopeptide repeat protein [Stellaceae bacterium]|nr:tetratricopeptide repeat protein [Stellaceae bacterium]
MSADVGSQSPPGSTSKQQVMPIPQVLALAEQHRAAGRLDVAQHLCQQILRAQPRNAEALHLLGITLHQGGQPAAAIDVVTRAIAANASVPLYHSNLGEMLRLAGRAEEAVAAGSRAVALQPNFTQALNNLGIAYYDRGEWDEAIVYYRRALAVDPGFAEAHNNLGNAFRAQKKYPEAIAAYHRALQLKPGYSDAYNNLGTAIRDQKKPKDAEEPYRKAMALKPRDPSILNNLALTLMDLDRPDEALSLLQQSIAVDPRNHSTFTYFASAYLEKDMFDEARAACERALSLKPDDPDALNIMGQILFEQGQSEAALASFEKALALKPDLSDAYNNMGNTLKELGRFDEARDAYFKALAIDPKATGVLLNLADAKKFAPGDPHLLTLEALAADLAALSEEEQMQLHFALGKAYGDLGRHEDSFRHLLQGNALKRRTVDYNEGATAQFFDRIRAVFTPELIAKQTGHGDPSRLPIFILGMPRSGTTLVEQVLASHRKVFGAGEIKDLDIVVQSVRTDGIHEAPYPDYVTAFGPEQLRQFGAQYVKRLGAYSTTAERITNKMPSNFFYVGLIHLALPHARIIHTRRDPIDTCVSCFSKLFSGAQNYSYELGELGRYYRRYDELMAHWRRVLPADAMLEVPYEELVEDFDPLARRIVDYCGLEWDDACLAFHETKRPVRTASASQVRRPIFKSSVGRWRAYQGLLEPLIRELPLEREATAAPP